MRIGVNTFQLHRKITGAGRFTKNLVRALSEADTDNEYFLFLRRDNASYYSIKKENFINVKTNVTRRIRTRRILCEQVLLPRLARKYNLDIFWSPSDIAPIRIPCISTVTIHDLKRFVMPLEFPYMERHYYQLFMKRTSKSADLIFTVSESSGHDIMKYLNVPAERIVVAHNGIDPTLEEDDGIPFDSLKRIHGINRKFILFVGQMIKSKNVPRMIRAFKRCKEAKDYDFVLLGQPAAGSHEIEQTIKRISGSGDIRERIHRVKWATTEQLVSFYKSASALFYASLYEGFGFPLIEAMAFGLPIITSSLSSMPEVAGDAALLVNPKDTDQMSDALGKILTDDDTRKNLIEKGYERVKLFSWKNTAQKYLSVFNRLGKSL